MSDDQGSPGIHDHRGSTVLLVRRLDTRVHQEIDHLAWVEIERRGEQPRSIGASVVALIEPDVDVRVEGSFVRDSPIGRQADVSRGARVAEFTRAGRWKHANDRAERRLVRPYRLDETVFEADRCRREPVGVCRILRGNDLHFPGVAVTLDPYLPLVCEAVAQQRGDEGGATVPALPQLPLESGLELEASASDGRAAIGDPRPIRVNMIVIWLSSRRR